MQCGNPRSALDSGEQATSLLYWGKDLPVHPASVSVHARIDAPPFRSECS